MRRLLIGLIFVILGCGGSSPGMRGAPVSVTGRVSQAGQPVGGVAVSFQPLDTGHMKSLPVNADGTFAGELVAGTYAYTIVASSADSLQVLRKIGPQYLEASMERTVKVVPGQELQIMLD